VFSITPQIKTHACLDVKGASYCRARAARHAHGVASPAKRINLTLDEEHAHKLSMLAERSHVQEGTLARSLLSTALDDADPDATRITEILNAIPGAWERTLEGLEQADRSEGKPLDDLI
jgi:hypothetical protein